MKPTPAQRKTEVELPKESRGNVEPWQVDLRRHAEELRRYAGDGHLYVVITIPSPDDLTDEELDRVQAGGPWPVRSRLVELPAEQCRLIEFLADAAMAEWTAKCE